MSREALLVVIRGHLYGVFGFPEELIASHRRRMAKRQVARS